MNTVINNFLSLFYISHTVAAVSKTRHRYLQLLHSVHIYDINIMYFIIAIRPIDERVNFYPVNGLVTNFLNVT